MLRSEKNVPVPRAEINKLVTKTNVSVTSKTPISILPLLWSFSKKNTQAIEKLRVNRAALQLKVVDTRVAAASANSRNIACVVGKSTHGSVML